MESAGATTTVYLARHGETHGNREGRFQGYESALSDVGCDQARKLATRIAALKAAVAPEAIYTSDLLRARQTAQFIGEKTPVPVTTTPLLRELDAGDWKGRTRADVDREAPGAFQRWVLGGGVERLPGGECVADVLSRTSALWDSALTAHRGGRVLLVSHGWALSILLAKLQGWEVGVAFGQQRIRLGNTALSIVDVGPLGERDCKLLGCTAHLGGDEASGKTPPPAAF